MSVLGIDFGTSKTIVSWLNPRTKIAETLKCFNHDDMLLSVVCVTSEDRVICGKDAEQNGLSDPLSVRRKFKLQLGRNDILIRKKTRSGVVEYTAKDLVYHFFKYIRKKCQETSELSGAILEDVVITVPVIFSEAQKQDLLEAAKKAGFKNVQIELEPEAAAIAYIKASSVQTSRALVVDWGGGTFDTTLVTMDSSANIACERKFSKGDCRIGGEEIDRKFIDYIIERYKQQGANIPEIDFDDTLDAAEAIVNMTERYRLQKGILEDKCRLDNVDEIKSYPMGGKGNSPLQQITISRRDFCTVAKKELDIACSIIKELLEEIPADMQPERLLLAGRTCRSKVIQEALKVASGLEITEWQNSREAISLGAVYLGNGTNKSNKNISDLNTQEKDEILEMAESPNTNNKMSGGSYMGRKPNTPRHKTFS